MMPKMKYVAALLCAMSLSLSPVQAKLPDKVMDLSLTELRHALDTKEFTAQQLVEACLQRIAKHDKQGLAVHAVISLNDQALAQAKAFDMHNDGHNPPLAGIPFLVKDNINSKGLATTGGCLALSDNIPDKNAFALQLLLDQGAILLGKTNLSELAASYGRLGYSSVGGQTVNPYNQLRDASGSSSGSAVATALRFAPFALGTDTSASIRAPASTTGTVGLRPSLGLISRSGVIPLSLTADTVGVITKDVPDQAVVLDVLNQADPADAATLNLPRQAGVFEQAIKHASLQGKRIGVVTNFDHANAEIDALKQQAMQRLKDKGAVLVELKLPEIFNDLWSVVLGPVGDAEFTPQMNAYLSTLPPSSPHNYSEFMQLLRQRTHAGTYLINPGRYQALQAAATTTLTDGAQYIDILSNVIPGLRRMYQDLMDGKNLDALFFATMRCPPSVISTKSDPTYKCSAPDPYTPSYMASALGVPEISLPSGRDSQNLPIGMSFMGRFGQDPALLGLAQAFMQ